MDPPNACGEIARCATHRICSTILQPEQWSDRRFSEFCCHRLASCAMIRHLGGQSISADQEAMQIDLMVQQSSEC